MYSWYHNMEHNSDRPGLAWLPRDVWVCGRAYLAGCKGGVSRAVGFMAPEEMGKELTAPLQQRWRLRAVVQKEPICQRCNSRTLPSAHGGMLAPTLLLLL